MHGSHISNPGWHRELSMQPGCHRETSWCSVWCDCLQNDKGGEAAVQGGVANPTTPALKYGSSGATLGQTWQPRW